MSYYAYVKYSTGPDKRKYYFTGFQFTTIAASKKIFTYKKQVLTTINRFFKKTHTALPKGSSLHIEPIKKIVKKNPINYSTNRKIQKAIENFEEFTGHKAEFIDKKNLPNLDVAFKIGTCDGIMYTTVRDGRTEKYVHRFKGRARPILVSNFDGSFITLIGGRYKFTDRGIVDT